MAADAPRFRKRIVDVTIPAGQTSKAVAVGLGGVKYARCNQFRALITSGTDTSTSLEIKDAKGRVIFTAGTLNFTAAVNRVFFQDDTAVGSGFTVTDATGAAAAAGQVAPAPIVEGPLTVTWSAATAGETLRVELLVEV